MGPPVVLVIEDFHAARGSTIALIKQVLAAANLPFLIVACSQRQALTRNKEAEELTDLSISPVTKIHIDKLEQHDIITLAKELLPHTSEHLLEILANRADGNAYILKLQLLSLRRHINRETLTAKAWDLAQLPIELNEILLRLWQQLPDEHQQLLGVLSLVGHKAPRALDSFMLSGIDQLRGHSPSDTGWVRDQFDQRTFLEVARWQLVKQYSLPILTGRERKQAVAAALTIIVEQLRRRTRDQGFEFTGMLRSCLYNLLPEAQQFRWDYDRLAVAEKLTQWGQSLHWDRMYEEALRVLALSEQALEHHSVRRTPRGMELMCLTLRTACASTKLTSGYGAGHTMTVDSAQHFLD